MPDPFVIAVLLTAFTCILAFAIAPKASPSVVLTGWYGGVFKIASLAFLVALTLVTGHALSTSKPVAKLLSTTASFATTPAGAMTLTFFVSMIGGLLNWAVGLVVSALFAREVAKRVRVDFAWLVAAAYAGWSFYVCASAALFNLTVAAIGGGYIAMKVVAGTFKLDLNMLVLIFLLLGMLLHWKPKAYLGTVNNAARIAGPILIQFPLYGGLSARHEDGALLEPRKHRRLAGVGHSPCSRTGRSGPARRAVSVTCGNSTRFGPWCLSWSHMPCSIPTSPRRPSRAGLRHCPSSSLRWGRSVVCSAAR